MEDLIGLVVGCCKGGGTGQVTGSESVGSERVGAVPLHVAFGGGGAETETRRDETMCGCGRGPWFGAS